jgi:outer membrane protein assembly factor BamB
LDKHTGKTRWRTARDAAAKKKFSFSTPIVIDVEGRRQIISPASDYIFAYDLSGKQIWKSHYPGGYSVVPRPLYANGLIYVSSGYDRPVVYAVRPTGSGDVTETHVVWKTDKNAPRNSSPLVVGDLFFMAADTGVVSCLDANSGAFLWRERVARETSSSLLYSSGRIYLIDEQGKTYVFAAAPTYKLLAENDLADRSLASFAADDGTLYIRTASALWRIGEE